MFIRQYVYEQAPFRTATCPSYKHVLLLQSTSFLKEQRKLMFILTKELKTQHCKRKH